MRTILVVGGAGYIGSHMVDLLLSYHYRVIVLDDLSSGHRQAVIPPAELIVADMADRLILQDIFNRFSVDAVMHFAALSLVGNSVNQPADYYHNNVSKTLTLLEAMREAGVRYFIFSSTAAVFGHAEYLPIDDAHPQKPLNPYGRSKRMVEQILSDYDNAYGLRYAVLRYFNAAGADPAGRIGEVHNPETHLIPIALQVAKGSRERLSIYGTDYDTVDGTCCRDYIHVCDLADAHLLALKKIINEDKSVSYNLGNGNGFTVRQVVNKIHEVTGQEFPIIESPRRPGDPASLVADSTAAIQELGWKPRYDELTTIIQHAWQWEQSSKFDGES